MGGKAKTKDEQFIIKTYEMALSIGGPFEEVDGVVVGAAVGLSPKAVQTIVNLLAKANFVKKREDERLCLTKRGEELALRLLDES